MNMMMKYFFGVLLLLITANTMPTDNRSSKDKKHYYTSEAYAKYTKYQCRSHSPTHTGQFCYYSMFKIRYGRDITIIGRTASVTFLSIARIRKIDSFECKEYLKNEERYSSDTKKCKVLKKIVDRINFAYDQEDPSLISMSPDDLLKVVTGDTGDRER